MVFRIQELHKLYRVHVLSFVRSFERGFERGFERALGFVFCFWPSTISIYSGLEGVGFRVGKKGRDYIGIVKGFYALIPYHPAVCRLGPSPTSTDMITSQMSSVFLVVEPSKIISLL